MISTLSILGEAIRSWPRPSLNGGLAVDNSIIEAFYIVLAFFAPGLIILALALPVAHIRCWLSGGHKYGSTQSGNYERRCSRCGWTSFPWR